VDPDPWVLGQPGADLDVLVRGVVVHHQMQLGRLAVLIAVVGVGLGDLLEEGQELLVAVPRLAPRGHRRGGHPRRREQGARAVPDVVVGPAFRQSRLH